MFFVLYFFIFPIFYVWIYRARVRVDFNSIILLFFSIVFFLYVLISLLNNAHTLSFSISGPMVEFLTPMLILSSFFIYIYLTNQRYEVLRKSINVYIYVLLAILLFDVFWRYILNQECFMNYSCRKEAKIIGLFSTTNVIGTFILYLFFALKKDHFSFIKKIFIGILFTAMSRAAIVTLLFCTSIKMILSSNIHIRMFVFIICFVMSGYIYIYNPFGLMTDGSLLSKFEFIFSAISSIKEATTSEIILGFGGSFESITRVVGVEGYSPHSPFLKAYFYFGLLGLLFYIMFNLYFLLIDIRFFFFIILSAFINGIAGAPIYNPTIWVSFAIFILYQQGVRND